MWMLKTCSVPLGVFRSARTQPRRVRWPQVRSMCCESSIGQCFHLPGPGIGARKDLLQRNDICVKSAQDVGNALDGNAAIQASGLVDVVGNYTHSLGKFYPFSRPGCLPVVGSSLPK